jgi:hypothetical protein
MGGCRARVRGMMGLVESLVAPQLIVISVVYS